MISWPLRFPSDKTGQHFFFAFSVVNFYECSSYMCVCMRTVYVLRFYCDSSCFSLFSLLDIVYWPFLIIRKQVLLLYVFVLYILPLGGVVRTFVAGHEFRSVSANFFLLWKLFLHFN